MKKTILLILTLSLFLGFNTFAQTGTPADTTKTETATPAEEPASEEVQAPAAAAEAEGIKEIRNKFIEGGPEFMALPLLCLIIGLAIIIERLITLFSIPTNSAKFIQKVEDALVSGGVEAAKDLCRNTRGPVASIFYQGLDRTDEGIDMVEKSVVSYGGVQMGQLERGLIWISLFIALAPMLGFLGTVIGMVEAFDDIEKAGDISPTIVAKGIKVALLTTVAGLIVAMILQVFYNLLVSKIDAIVNNMEDASIKLVDMLLRNNIMKG